MKCMNKGRSFNMPFTELVYRAHDSDLVRWIKEEEQKGNAETLRLLNERKARLDATFKKLQKEGKLQ